MEIQRKITDDFAVVYLPKFKSTISQLVFRPEIRQLSDLVAMSLGGDSSRTPELGGGGLR